MVLLFDFVGKGGKIRSRVVIAVKGNVPVFVIHKDGRLCLFMCFCFFEKSEYIRFLLSCGVVFIRTNMLTDYYSTSTRFFQVKCAKKRRFTIFLRFWSRCSQKAVRFFIFVEKSGKGLAFFDSICYNTVLLQNKLL